MTTVYNEFHLCFVAGRTIFDTFFREVLLLTAWLVIQESGRTSLACDRMKQVNADGNIHPMFSVP